MIMVMTGVMAASGTGQSARTSTGTTQSGKTGNDAAFSNMMSASISIRQTSQKSVTVTSARAASARTDRAKASADAAAQTKTEQPEQLQTQQPEKTEPSMDALKEAQGELAKETQALTEQVGSETEQNESAKMLLAQIKSLMEEILELDEKELNALMEQMGITMVDLLSPAVMQQLVMESGGAKDVSALLTDESLSDKLTKLLGQTEQMLNQAGVTAQELTAQMTGGEFEEVMAPLLTQETQPVLTGSEKETNPESEQTKVEGTGEAAESFQFEAVRETTQSEGGTGNSTDGSTQTGTTADANAATNTTEPEITQAEQFLNLVSNAANQTEETMFQELTPAQQIREIADQILEKIRVVVQPDTTSMEITLNPESLGRVSLNLISRQGVMTAQFTTQSQVAREAIESQMIVLRENLENQGLKVDSIEVTVSNFGFGQSTDTNGSEQQNAPSGRRRSIRLEEDLSFEALTEAEAIAADLLEQSGNSVDFIA